MRYSYQKELIFLSHQTGRQFDKTGKLTDWWTKGTIKRYQKLTQCIVDQYAKYFVLGPDGKKYHVNVSLEKQNNAG